MGPGRARPARAGGAGASLSRLAPGKLEQAQYILLPARLSIRRGGFLTARAQRDKQL